MQYFFIATFMHIVEIGQVSRLYTFTGNLLAETSLEYDAINLGRTQRAIVESFQVGGKGINVSRYINDMGVDSSAIFFCGGHTGNRCMEWLKNNCEFRLLPIRINYECRQGFVVRSKNSVETTFLGKDIDITEEDFLRAINTLRLKMKRDDILALCGSFPSFTKNMAIILKNFILEKNVKFFLDSYGKPLKFLYKFADIIKINRDEFSGIYGGKDIESEFKKFAKKFPKKILAITNGKDFSLFYSDGIFGKVFPQKIKEISATGCGDMISASIIKSYINKNTISIQDFGNATKLASRFASRKRFI